jgi:hypothetical protein
MFGQKIAFLQPAVCGLLLGSHILAAKVDVKQSEQVLEIRNGKLALNIVKGGSGVEVSYQLDGNVQRATTLNVVQKDAPAGMIRTFKLVQNTPEVAVVEVEYAFTSGTAVTVVYTVKDNFEYVGAESDFAHGNAAISAAMQSEVLILPDSLGESMVFYPESAPASAMNIPSDNHLLVNLCDQGNSMLALLWDSPKMNISECKAGNRFEAIALSADAKARFWIGALAAKSLWYKASETLNSTSFTALNWTPPFPAEWMLATFLDKGFHVDCPTSESWFLIPKENRHYGEFFSIDYCCVVLINPSVWQAGASGLGGFVYPCYFLDGKTFATKTVFPNMDTSPVFGDSACLIYALRGSDTTLAGVTMPENALEKMLSKELNNSIEAMRSPKDIYPATCGITEKVEKIFYRSESVKDKGEIISDFTKMNMFVLTIRERIEDYVSWQRKMSRMLDEWEMHHPHLPGVADDLNREIARIAFWYANVKDRMKTPPYCTTLTEKLIALTDANLSDEEKEDRCKDLCRQIRTIGGSQDTTLGVFRSIVKATRQDATRKLMATDDSITKELLENVRTETGTMLTGRFGMEGK